MRRTTAGLLTLALMAGLAACGSDDDDPGSAPAASSDGDKPPVRLALISVKTPGLNLLDPFKAGADAAAAKVNAAGGIGGRKVVIDTCNSLLQSTAAVNCARSTLKDDPVAQFGCEVSWSATGLPLYAKAGVPSFNCMNTPEDFENPMSFGLSPSTFGMARGSAKYLCERDGVETVGVIAQDLPQQRRDTPRAVESVLEGCGKRVEYAYLPYASADLTPHFNKLMQAKPDFVINQAGALQTLELFKFLKQAGFPPSQTISTDGSFGYETVLEPSGDAVEGALSTFEFASWDDKDNPDVVEYLDAMEGSDVDGRDAVPAWGYSTVMWVAAVAEALGAPDEFDGEALAAFTSTENGTPIPMSRTLTNPGPEGFPQQKQPYVQIVQWKDGKLHVIEEGTDEGWVSGY